MIYGHIGSPTYRIRKSTNGGISWFSILFVDTTLNKLHFIDVNTGTVVGSLGTIRRTTNGGSTWINQTNIANTLALRCVKFINTNTGFIGADGRRVLFTTDGGTNWESRSPLAADGYWADLFFFDANTGIVVGLLPISACGIFTTNAGSSWGYPPGLTSSYVYSISFANNLTGFCCGTKIFKSTNGGADWFTVMPANKYSFYDISVTDVNNAIAVGGGPLFQGGDGKILKTTNSGMNWIEQIPGTNKRFSAVSFIDQNTGWACGDSGTLVKTTTGGVITGFGNNSEILPDKFSLNQNYPNPFNPLTRINYELQITNYVTLNVYDVNGRLVKELVNQKQSAGNYSIDFDGRGLPSGTYIYRLQAGDFSETKKMVLLK